MDPLSPLQLRVKVFAPTFAICTSAEPFRDFTPDQSPDAKQEFTF